MKRYTMLAVLCIILALIAYCASCTTASLEPCEQRQYIQIKQAWRAYELKTNRRVVFPDWRLDALKWARVECDFGRPVRAFRP